ncbi:hypothetical protein, partial [uncultured Deinococcus sp.]|uniref:DUF7674 family protein n=1 Tax=uncultured Deinococcus sp. TaxID=158789 RepID=UPI0025DE0D79
MIRPADVPTLLREAFPAFQLVDEAPEFPAMRYLVLTVFARQAVATAWAGNLDDFPTLFLVAERILNEGDQDAQTRLVTGLLEAFQGEASRRPGQRVRLTGSGNLTSLGPEQRRRRLE